MESVTENNKENDNHFYENQSDNSLKENKNDNLLQENKENIQTYKCITKIIFILIILFMIPFLSISFSILEYKIQKQITIIKNNFIKFKKDITYTSKYYQKLPDLTCGRKNPVQLLKIPDGRIYIDGDTSGYDKKFPDFCGTNEFGEIYNPTTKTFSLTNSKKNRTRETNQSVEILKDGNVFLYSTYDQTIEIMRIYDTAKNQYRILRIPVNYRGEYYSVNEFENGKILISGGEGIYKNNYEDKAEIYNYKKNIFEKTISMNKKRGKHKTIKLQDGKIFIIGGESKSGIENSTEIYNPKTQQFIDGPDMHYSRRNAEAVILPDGKVLIMYGNTVSEKNEHIVGNFIFQIEIYDPKTNTINLPNIDYSLLEKDKDRQYGKITLLSDDLIFIMHPNYKTTLYSISKNKFFAGPNSYYEHEGGGVITVKDKEALLIGGSRERYSSSNKAELFVFKDELIDR